MPTIKNKKALKPRHEKCCEPDHNQTHPDHSESLPRLNRIEGQISGVKKMIQEGRYCVDILVQCRAVMAALRSVEVSIFEKHLQHCVSAALLAKDQAQVDLKIKELTELLNRRTLL